MLIESGVPSLKEVKVAWNVFNGLTAPVAPEAGSHGSPLSHYKARNEAWKNYTKLRDYYLHSVGMITLNQLNAAWYPSLVQHYYSPRSIHKN